MFQTVVNTVQVDSAVRTDAEKGGNQRQIKPKDGPPAMVVMMKNLT